MSAGPVVAREMTNAHPFAQFGPAPYRCTGLETIDDRQAANDAAEAAGLPFTTNMCGGSCDLCGTAIWNVYRFEAANGVRFKVGCDCAKKAGEGAETKRAKRDRTRAIREAAARRSLEERLEAERDANEAAGHGRVTNDEHAENVRREREAAEQARRDASEHIGTPKQRFRKVEIRYEGHFAGPGIGPEPRG